MADKVTWNDVYKDFKKRYPKKGKEVLGFQPHSYATIRLIFPDGIRMLYNYDTKKATKIEIE